MATIIRGISAKRRVKNTSNEEKTSAKMQEREILFKAKRTDNGEWVEGCLLIDYVTGQYFIHANGNSVNESDKVGEEGCLRFFAFEVEKTTLCQYTGLTDKNGKKIWENDIVKGVAYSTDFIGRIIWIDKIAGFGVRYFNEHREPTAWENSSILKHMMSGRTNEFAAEAIGNIFDNPELLRE